MLRKYSQLNMHTFDHPVLIDVHDSEWQQCIEKLMAADECLHLIIVCDASG